MLLVTLTINGTDHYISDEYLKLDHLWKAKIVSFNNVRYATATDHGGYVESKFGSIVFLPDLFTGTDFLPPVSCDITVQYSDTTEAAAKTLFTGVSHRTGVQQDQIAYKLFGPDDSTSASVAFTGNLEAEFSAECTALGLTLDATRTTRAATLDTNYSPSGDKDRITALSELAAFFSHYFWIDGSVLYLADMLLDNGSTLALTEFDIMPSSYADSPPYSLFKSGDWTVDGAYGYGQEFSLSATGHTTQANVETVLTDIKTIIERQHITIKAPLEAANIPDIGQKITLADESLQEPADIIVWARSIVYNFNAKEMIIEGDGSIT